MFRMQSTYLLKLTVRLRLPYICFCFTIERSLGPDPSPGLKVWGEQNIFRRSRLLFSLYRLFL